MVRSISAEVKVSIPISVRLEGMYVRNFVVDEKAGICKTAAVPAKIKPEFFVESSTKLG